jgi:2-alkenal reductase
MSNKRVTVAGIATLLVLTVGCASLPFGLGRSETSNSAAVEQTQPQTQSEQGMTTRIESAPAAPQPTPTAVPEAVRMQFDDDEQVLTNLYERANPAVVAISIRANIGRGDAPSGSGSGFVISADGYIVTNNHVVDEADRVDVIFSDGTFEQARVVGADRYSDLALLKVERTSLSFVELADSDQVKVGQRVIAIGNPFGLQGTMTLGIVSAKGRTLPEAAPDGSSSFSNPDIIQTDAAINPGNSGGPLLDTHGRVVGVNSAIRSGSNSGLGQPANSGVGFAVPSNTVKRVVAALREEGSVRYPYLGIQGSIPLNLVPAEFNIPVKRGVMINSVADGGPVARAGLRGAQVRQSTIEHPGDIIVAFNGKPVRDYDDLIAQLVSTSKPGDVVTLTIWRDGKQMDMQVTLGERPE